MAAGVRTNFGSQQNQIDDMRARASNVNPTNLDRAGQRHQYNLNTIKVAKAAEQNYGSFDVN